MRDDRDFTQYGRTIRVEGGIRAQSTRGAIGESWWSKRFIAVLESLALGTRLSRGRSYARAGQVLRLDIAAGEVTASVQGSRPTPYAVSIGLRVIDERSWSTIEQALAGQALFGARLLAGEMPREIEEVFTAAGAPLFPTNAGQLAMRCSCPDWTVPCKHLAATIYLLAEAFDADPFQILHWRGRERQALLARLRALRTVDDAGHGGAVGAGAVGGDLSGDIGMARKARRGGRRERSTSNDHAPDGARLPGPDVTGAAIALAELTSPDLADTVDRFWVAPVPLPARPPSLVTDVDLLLRQLPAPGATLGGAGLTARLRPLYAAFALPDPSPPPHDRS